jgi:multiple sugar transport system permease protein
MATTSSVGTTSSSRSAPKKQASKVQKQEWLMAFLFLLPSLIGLIVFFLIPVLAGFGISFMKWDLLTTPEFVGLDNYKTLLTDDPLFWVSLQHTLVYSLMVIGIGVPLSLGLALVVNSKIKGIEIFRTIYFVPVVCSTIAAALVWKWIFQPEMGILNTMLRWFSIKGPLWLGSEQTALISVAIVAIWLGLGYNMVILLAGLKGIPPHLYEAAAIDGAVGVQQFWYITLPLLTPTLFFVLVMSVIGSFQVFGQVFVMTVQGGPNNATLTYVYYLWRNAFQYFKMGYASALAYVLFFIILVVTVIQMKFLGGRINYELD